MVPVLTVIVKSFNHRCETDSTIVKNLKYGAFHFVLSYVFFKHVTLEIPSQKIQGQSMPQYP